MLCSDTFRGCLSAAGDALSDSIQHSRPCIAVRRQPNEFRLKAAQSCNLLLMNARRAVMTCGPRQLMWHGNELSISMCLLWSVHSGFVRPEAHKLTLCCEGQLKTRPAELQLVGPMYFAICPGSGATLP